MGKKVPVIPLCSVLPSGWRVMQGLKKGYTLNITPFLYASCPPARCAQLSHEGAPQASPQKRSCHFYCDFTSLFLKAFGTVLVWQPFWGNLLVVPSKCWMLWIRWNIYNPASSVLPSGVGAQWVSATQGGASSSLKGMMDTAYGKGTRSFRETALSECM